MKRAMLPLVLAAALTACSAGGGPIKLPSTKPAAGIVTNTSANIVTNTSANLTVSGTVRVPVGIVTNTSANIVTNTSANRRLFAGPEEKPLAGAVVAILDAKGQPVLVDGKPLTTKTDAQGRYQLTFPGARANRQLAVDLGNGASLRALTARRSTVDLDLASTMASTYILDRYVQGQPDPDGVMDRLEAAAADEARAQVQAALAVTPVPTSLAETELVNAVAKLRAGHPGLDAALEKVHQLLLAGLSNLGEGQDAQGLSLSRIGGLAVDAGGALNVNCAWAHRVWRLASDNTLRTVAGTGAPVDTASLQGAEARATAFGFLAGLARDADGRLVLLEDNRLTRVEADGKLTELVPRAAWPADAGNGLGVFVRGDATMVVTETSIYNLGATLTLVRRLAKEEQAKAKGGTLALAPDGNLWAARSEYPDASATVPVQTVYKLDGAVTPLTSNGAGTVLGLALDPSGVVFKLEADRRLTALLPDGSAQRLATAVPTTLRLDPNVMVAYVGPDLAYVATRDGDVYRVAGGQLQHVVGAPPALPAAVTGPSALALDAPSGLAEAANGDLIIAETHAHRVTRLSPDGKVALLAGTGEPGYPTDGPVAGQPLWNPSVVGVDARGTVYVLDNTYPNDEHGNYLRAIDAAGSLRTVHAFRKDDESVRDFAVAPDGGLYVSLVANGKTARVSYYPADGGAPTAVIPDTAIAKATVPPHTFSTATRLTVALAADGKTLYVSGLGKLWRWTAAGGSELVAEDPVFLQVSRFKGLALDARGRLYLANLDQVLTYDPATRAHQVLAGEGGSHFGGGSVDDSLLEPTNPLVTRAGSLLLLDREHRQIKALPPGEL